MAWYRMYFLSSLGHFEGTKEINCSDDAEAIAALDSTGCNAELWQRDRFVKGAGAPIGSVPARGDASAGGDQTEIDSTDAGHGDGS